MSGKWALNVPKEVCDTVGKYSEWVLDQYERQTRFGFGMDDVTDARRGYDLSFPIFLAVWKACENRFERCKTRHFTVYDLIDIIKEEGFLNVPFDRTTICHAIGKLRALGLVYRMGSGVRECYEYIFEDVIMEKGMDWFLKNNPFIGGPDGK